MSIEQKIAEILAESRAAKEQQVEEEVKLAGAETGAKDVTANASASEPSNIEGADDGVTECGDDEENNKRNAVVQQDVGGTEKKANPANSSAAAPEASNIAGMKEDIDALVSGENLTEEFKEKAATIFEAAVMNRVKAEVARIDEAYEQKLNEHVEQIKEGLVEKVDGYLDYVVEQWFEQNEIALESGMKSEILEGFVAGLKGLFEEHYIDIPEEKFDVLGEMQEEIDTLGTKLNEQVEANIDLKSQLSQYKVAQIVDGLSEGLVDTDKEKFVSLVEELEFDGVESFEKKAQTIRESYFTKKAPTTLNEVGSIVTDAPVIDEETKKRVSPTMQGYLSALNNIK